MHFAKFVQSSAPGIVVVVAIPKPFHEVVAYDRQHKRDRYKDHCLTGGGTDIFKDHFLFRILDERTESVQRLPDRERSSSNFRQF